MRLQDLLAVLLLIVRDHLCAVRFCKMASAEASTNPEEFAIFCITVPKVLSDYYDFPAPAPGTIRVGGILLLPND